MEILNNKDQLSTVLNKPEYSDRFLTAAQINSANAPSTELVYDNGFQEAVLKAIVSKESYELLKGVRNSFIGENHNAWTQNLDNCRKNTSDLSTDEARKLVGLLGELIKNIGSDLNSNLTIDSTYTQGIFEAKHVITAVVMSLTTFEELLKKSINDIDNSWMYDDDDEF